MLLGHDNMECSREVLICMEEFAVSKHICIFVETSEIGHAFRRESIARMQ